MFTVILGLKSRLNLTEAKMELITLKDYAHQTGRPIATIYDRIGIFKIKPVSKRSRESAALFDRDLLESKGIGSVVPLKTGLPPKRSHRKGPATRKNEIKDETPIGVIAAPRNYNCPEYSACLSEAAFKNTSLKCSGCTNEKASIKSLDVDFTETTREMSGATVYRMPFK